MQKLKIRQKRDKTKQALRKLHFWLEGWESHLGRKREEMKKMKEKGRREVQEKPRYGMVWNLHKFGTSPWYGTIVNLFFCLNCVGKILLEMLLIGMRWV